MSSADGAAPVSGVEARSLFADLADHPVLILAVSGGPDSTALMVLAARWRKAMRRGPKLVAVTIDHGLRPEARREAAAVRRLARSLGVAHRTLHWRGQKPATGVQQAARQARYALLGEAARKAGAHHVLTAHTLDDQAETVLIRLTRGSGLGGLAAMARSAPLPVGSTNGITLVRPLLDLPKARLIATLRKEGIHFAEDPSNADPRFARARLRGAMAVLAREGLTSQRLALLAQRVRRAEAALDAAVTEAGRDLAPPPWPERGPVVLSAQKFAALAAEVSLRLLGRAIAAIGDEGPVELGKLEALHSALAGPALAGWSGGARIRRTLAGAVITHAGGQISVERAPARGNRAPKRP